jgi:hypothetical protein
MEGGRRPYNCHECSESQTATTKTSMQGKAAGFIAELGGFLRHGFGSALSGTVGTVHRAT